MNQVDSMLMHVDLLVRLYEKFLTIEYQRSLIDVERKIAATEDFEQEPDDDDAERRDNPPSVKMFLDTERAYNLALQAADRLMLNMGFCEPTPPDDMQPGRRGIRAAVPAQFRGDIPTPGNGKRSSTSEHRSFSRVETASLIERCLQGTADEFGVDISTHGGREQVQSLRDLFVVEFQRAGFDIEPYKRPRGRRQSWDKGDSDE